MCFKLIHSALLAALLALVPVFSFPLRAEVGIVDPNAGKVAEEINPDDLPWLGTGIAKCTVDDRLLEKDANAMGYYYAQRPEHRHGFKKGYDNSVAKYRLSKVECLQKIFTDEFGKHLTLKTALIFSDFRNAVNRLKSWGVYFQQQQVETCPLAQIESCAEYMTRLQKDTQMGWAMARVADDLGAQIQISTKTELGEAFERANRSLPRAQNTGPK